MHGSVKVIEKSTNRKLSPVKMVPSKSGHRDSPRAVAPFCSSTYVSIAKTCPEECKFKAASCYVRAGFTGAMAARLDEFAEDLTAEDVTTHEAWAIFGMFGGKRIPQDGARGGRDLRLHVGGDVSPRMLPRLAAAARDWVRRGGGAVWTFTKRWREAPRQDWNGISVLASVDDEHEAAEALDAGYSPALTVERFDTEKAFMLGDVKFIPCPGETRDKTCVECRLCLDVDLATKRTGIAFALHGKNASRVDRKRLKVL